MVLYSSYYNYEMTASMGLLFGLLVVFKGLGRNLVEGQDGLVGLSHEDVLAFLLLVEELDEHAHHGPHLTFAEGDLCGKVLGAIELGGQDDVLVGVFGSRSATKANLHLVGSRKEGLGGPLGELEGVVLEFVGQNSTTLAVDFVPLQSTA